MSVCIDRLRYGWLSLILLCWTQHASGQPVRDGLDQLLMSFAEDSILRHAHVALNVIDLQSDRVVVQYNADLAMVPASTLKLITCGMLFFSQSEMESYTTPVQLEGYFKGDSGFVGKLVIAGRGDPSLGSPYMPGALGIDSIASQISGALLGLGIQRLEGSLEVDETHWFNLPENPEWLYYDLGNYYGGGCRAFNWSENEVTVGLSAADRPGAFCALRWTRPPEAIGDFTSFAKGTRSAVVKPNLYVIGTSFDRHKRIYGIWKCCTDDSIVLRAAMYRPAEHFLRSLKGELVKRGISFYDGIETDRQQTNVRLYPLTEIHSPALGELAHYALERSSNLYCEAFLHWLGNCFTGTSDRDTALQWLTKTLAGAVMENHAFKMLDGSGLSPKNLISASNMTAFLQHLALARPDQNFWEWIPEFFPLSDKSRDSVTCALRLKSGSMERVRAFAGYCVRSNQPTHAISLMVNNFVAEPTAVQRRISSFLVDLKGLLCK